jgi:hypothetical protein
MRTAIAALCLVAAAGCGKVRLPDSARTDGGGDADAAVPGPVTVTVLSFDGRQAPLAGVPVGFFDAAGAHQATVETDADGVATSDLLAGGGVVAFLGSAGPAGAGTQIARAVLAVAPGDQIVIGGEPGRTGNLVNAMTVNLPAVAGATTYQLNTSCGTYSAATTAITIEFYPSCDTDTFSFVAVTSGDAGRQYLREENVATVPNGTYDAMASWQMMPTRPFLFTGLPGEAATVEAHVVAVRTGDHQLDLALNGDSQPVAEDMITLRPERIPSYDATLVWSRVQPEQPALGWTTISRWLGPDDSTDLDVGDLMLPWIGPVSFESASRTFRTTLVGDQEFDAALLTLVASVNDGEVFREISWFVVAPPGLEEVVLPEVPAAQSDYVLPDPDNVYADAQIVESDQIDGYPAARQLGFGPFAQPLGAPLGSVTRVGFSAAIER